jgi:lysophospholipase L1-like esterase
MAFVRMLLLAVLLIIGTSIPSDIGTPSSASSPVSPSDGAPVYLALGDSLAYGSGASDPETYGYVPLVLSYLQASAPCQPDGTGSCPQLQLLNLAENGATTVTLRERQLPRALEVIESRNGDGDPGNDVTVITLDIGGNDAFRALQHVCAAGLSTQCMSDVTETFATIEENLTETLVMLRHAAGPDTRIAVMTYFNSLLACDKRASVESVDLLLEGVPGIVSGLNDVIRQAAATADAVVADTFGLLGPSDLVGGSDCLHPNDAGYKRIARAFALALADRP